MYQPYICCVNSYTDHYVNQAGNGLSYYQGMRLQKGSGLGGIFRSLFRYALPLFKTGAKAVGKQFLRSGVDVANDLVQGKDLKTAAKNRAKEAGVALTDKAVTKVKNMLGSGRNKKKRKRKTILSRSKVRKVCTPDIFDQRKKIKTGDKYGSYPYRF